MLGEAEREHLLRRKWKRSYIVNVVPYGTKLGAESFSEKCGSGGGMRKRRGKDTKWRVSVRLGNRIDSPLRARVTFLYCRAI